ncbi:phage integrase central domain-containing protein [Deefgea piscis]|uniref:phage integrase central domain-containing protein n=1 Tax=Deefgea piscis TaxID=2739061 RepID=UPI001C81F58A|nr:integrase arm-type DNA-binding domain-containing protein [Deefgea piscis]QZA80117.1 integrase arm-type DNA-binding domain-containing protein [Deefgea piscis]
MARQTKPLSSTECSSAKAKEKDYRLYDGGGLFLLVKSNGSKIWRFKYTKPNGTETLMSFGEFPVVTLANARGFREEAKSLLANSLDPIEERNRKKEAARTENICSFEIIAREWFERAMAAKSKSHRDRTINRLESDIFPWLGKREISTIDAPELLACLRRIEERGAIETAHRVRCVEAY